VRVVNIEQAWRANERAIGEAEKRLTRTMLALAVLGEATYAGGQFSGGKRDAYDLLRVRIDALSRAE
jgi:hypothetical protein